MWVDVVLVCPWLMSMSGFEYSLLLGWFLQCIWMTGKDSLVGGMNMDRLLLVRYPWALVVLTVEWSLPIETLLEVKLERFKFSSVFKNLKSCRVVSQH
jgi:hypothetical protein